MPDLPPPPVPGGASAPGPRLPAPPAGSPPAAPPAPPPPPASAFRAAPLAFALVLVNAFVACWFGTWGINGVNHCDDPNLTADTDCGLGFAFLFAVAWGFTFVMAVVAFGLAFVRMPRWAAWALCLFVIALMWVANLAALSAYQPRT